MSDKPAAQPEDSLLALPIEQAAKLVRSSARRLRNWDETGLVSPSIKRALSPRLTVRLYSFSDLIELHVVALLAGEPRITVQHIRKLMGELRRRGHEHPLRNLKYAVVGREIFVQEADGSWSGDRNLDQVVIEHVLPLRHIAARIRGAARRHSGQYGEVERRRGVQGSRPVFRGTRIPVDAVVDYLAHGYSEEQILAEFPDLTPADVATARRSAGAA